MSATHNQYGLVAPEHIPWGDYVVYVEVRGDSKYQVDRCFSPHHDWVGMVKAVRALPYRKCLPEGLGACEAKDADEQSKVQ